MTALAALAGPWPPLEGARVMREALSYRAPRWDEYAVGPVIVGGTAVRRLGQSGTVLAVDAPDWVRDRLPEPTPKDLSEPAHAVSWLAHMNGDAHAVLALGKDQLVVYRGLSARPLFYAQPSKRLAVATRPDPLVSLTSARVDSAGLAAFLIPQMCDPYGSAWQGIHRLPPRHALIWEHGETSLVPLPDPETPDLTGATDRELISLFRDALFTAVDRCSGNTDALLLSGGIDSSSLAGVYSATRNTQRVTAFGLTYTKWDACDERRYARDVAELPGIRLIELPADELLPITSPYMLGPEPEAWSYAGRNQALLNLISAHPSGAATVVAGEGGDELLLGQVFSVADRIAQGDPRGWKEVDTFPEPDQVRPVIQALLDGAYDTPIARLHRALAEIPPWLCPEWLEKSDVLRKFTSGYPVLGPPGGMTASYSRALFAESGAAGRAQCGGWWEDTGQRNGMTIVYPFLDPDLAELTWALPPHMFRDEGLEKHVLRQAVADTLPVSVRARPDKAEALYILNAGLTANLQQLRETITGPLAELGVLVPEQAENALQRYIAGDRRHAPAWWAMYAVHIWLLDNERDLP
ncbi:hypothetical protein GCM10027294_12210 [Marinactinospora endophytica]